MRRVALLIFISTLYSYELEDILSPEYKEFYQTQFQKNLLQRQIDSKSWISPIMLNFERSWDYSLEQGGSRSDMFSISIDQPIFKSGGIYYGIKFAKARYEVENKKLTQEKNSLIIKAIETLFNIRKSELNLEKLKLQLKNDEIDVKRKEEQFEVGLIDLIEVDKALAKKNQTQISILNLQSSIEELKGNFKKISNKDPNRLKLPKLRLISKKEFKDKNLELDIASKNIEVAKLNSKLVATKFLPTISIGASYTKLSPAPIGMKDSFSRYNLRVSMPLSINTKDELQKAKLEKIIAKINYKNSKKSIEQDYKIVRKKINLLDKEIKLAKKEANIYKRLLKNTNKLYRAGQATKEDVLILKNSYKIKKLEIKIYQLSKELELLKLYSKIDFKEKDEI
ncbi:MAG: TolC family protein [Epsilonproteobacteria bacterium]|nr:TolC family protein [Campylobacterota bacterium]